MQAINLFLCSPDVYKEKALTAALIVFVILTVLLITFVVLLFACKKFRYFFFKADDNDAARAEKKQKPEKPAKPAKAEKPAKQHKHQNRNSKEERKNEKARPPRRSAKPAGDGFDDNGVQTVPLNSEPGNEAVSTPAAAPHKNRNIDIFDRVPTVEIKTTAHDEKPATTEISHKPTAKPRGYVVSQKSAKPRNKNGN